MSEFEVLERLACDCGERPRMQELAAAVHLSQSALSRTVGRLEKDGWCTARCVRRTGAGWRCA